MKRALLAAFVLTLCFPLATGMASAEEATAEAAITLEGSFVWARGDGDIPGDLTAIMTPDGEDTWTIAFHFMWEEEPRTYTGTATGSLMDGELKGTALNDNPDRKMQFRFQGAFEDGTFNGTHGFVQEDGSIKDGGTLTLAHAKAAE